MTDLSRYQQQLADPRWQSRRKEILVRDGFTCRICGERDSTLHVHHRRYAPQRDAWDYPDGELETLCESCHGAVHTLRAKHQTLSPEARNEIFRKILGDQLFDAGFRASGFLICADPRDASCSWIIHEATSFWRRFALTAQAAYDMLQENPASASELRSLILHADA